MSNVRAIRRRPQHRACKRVSGGECRYFTYNDVNLVTTIEYPGGAANYFWYDAMMRRYAMQDSGGLSYFTWDQNGMNLLAERDSAGAVTAYYTHGFAAVDGIGSTVAVKQNRFGAAYFQYPGYDHKGSVTVVTDENGNEVARYNYTANGVTLASEVTGGINETRLGYQTNWIRLQDAPFDMYASVTRLEVPEYGLFLGRDPKKRLAGGCDYAGAKNPGYVDPDGADENSSTKNKKKKKKSKHEIAKELIKGIWNDMVKNKDKDIQDAIAAAAKHIKKTVEKKYPGKKPEELTEKEVKNVMRGAGEEALKVYRERGLKRLKSRWKIAKKESGLDDMPLSEKILYGTIGVAAAMAAIDTLIAQGVMEPKYKKTFDIDIGKNIKCKMAVGGEATRKGLFDYDLEDAYLGIAGIELQQGPVKAVVRWDDVAGLTFKPQGEPNGWFSPRGDLEPEYAGLDLKLMNKGMVKVSLGGRYYFEEDTTRVTLRFEKSSTKHSPISFYAELRGRVELAVPMFEAERIETGVTWKF